MDERLQIFGLLSFLLTLTSRCSDLHRNSLKLFTMVLKISVEHKMVEHNVIPYSCVKKCLSFVNVHSCHFPRCFCYLIASSRPLFTLALCSSLCIVYERPQDGWNEINYGSMFCSDLPWKTILLFRVTSKFLSLNFGYYFAYESWKLVYIKTHCISHHESLQWLLPIVSYIVCLRFCPGP